MDNKAIHQPMVTDQNEEQGSNIHPLSDHMNISVAFKEIVSKDPPRYTKFLEAINKTFEDISDCVGPEEFKNIMGDISFLKSKRNVTNLLSTLKTQISNLMSRHFEQIIEEENLSELFTKKIALNEEEAKKYYINNESMEIIELEETLRKLDVQIADLEETNEILFNQANFNEQRFDQVSERIEMLKDECWTKYTSMNEQIESIRKDFVIILKDNLNNE
ncbi:uncharacterized protein LOC111026264 [Myzus persicae]|uniref:uncharacterized protein LOC111026264 n=1 Tax=Myzus persicae TaxID=13164 RepID=UPI000B937412|nr:uncharacterized protein LOC111026264 [Myzus persicae]XP_022160019.1 uncharacterized protein LOC111026264 [Myzus persicae]XP_022160024.1 uncharacterized protein LOC111026264 [Myzus persicae]